MQLNFVRFFSLLYSNIPRASYETLTKYSALLKLASIALYLFISDKVSLKSSSFLFFFLKISLRKDLSSLLALLKNYNQR